MAVKNSNSVKNEFNKYTEKISEYLVRAENNIDVKTVTLNQAELNSSTLNGCVLNVEQGIDVKITVISELNQDTTANLWAELSEEIVNDISQEATTNDSLGSAVQEVFGGTPDKDNKISVKNTITQKLKDKFTNENLTNIIKTVNDTNRFELSNTVISGCSQNVVDGACRSYESAGEILNAQLEKPGITDETRKFYLEQIEENVKEEANCATNIRTELCAAPGGGPPTCDVSQNAQVDLVAQAIATQVFEVTNSLVSKSDLTVNTEQIASTLESNAMWIFLAFIGVLCLYMVYIT